MIPVHATLKVGEFAEALLTLVPSPAGGASLIVTANARGGHTLRVDATVHDLAGVLAALEPLANAIAKQFK